MSNQSATLLLVEDNEDDIFLMRRALKKAGITLPLQVAMDGQEALDYLGGAGRFSDRSQHPMPGLIFLDLKLPYVHGFEVLEWLRRQESLGDLPVVILTSSPEERDRQRASALGAKAYLVKPPHHEQLLQAMHYLTGETGGAASPGETIRSSHPG